MKFVSITHSERNIWNGPIDATAISREKVREYLNEHLPDRWVGRAAATDNTCTWPPRSPDLTVCDLFLWGFVKDNVYVPPLTKTLPEMQERINTAIRNITQDMVERVWREWEYCLDR